MAVFERWKENSAVLERAREKLEEAPLHPNIWRVTVRVSIVKKSSALYIFIKTSDFKALIIQKVYYISEVH